MASYRVNINMTRGSIKSLPEDQRRAEARREVKLVLVSGQATRAVTDEEIPDVLGAYDAATRFLDIEPLIAAVTPEFQAIVDEIEDTYVAGHFFAAIFASCVSIERFLNLARIEVHQIPQESPKTLDKKAPNAEDENIDALKMWGYIDDAFAKELEAIHVDIRNRYLHSGPITNIPADALRSVAAAYKLLIKT